MTATTVHYSLEVRSLTGIQHSSKRSQLHITFEFGKRRIKTGEIKSDRSPAWDGTLTFSSSSSNESSILKIRVIEKHKCIALVDVELSDLLSDYTDGKSPLDLFAPSGSSRVPAGSILLCVEEIDEASRAMIDVQCAEQDIKRIERSASAADSADRVGSVVEVVDKIVASIDDIVGDIHPYLKLAWTAATALYKIISYQWKTDKKLVDLVQAMQSAYEFARGASVLRDKASWLEGSIGELLRHTIQPSLQELNILLERILKITSRQRMDEYIEQFNSLRQDVGDGVAVHNASAVGDVSDKVNDIDLRQQFQLEEGRLQTLKDLLEPIRSEASGRPRCLPKTRADYLRQIKDWLFTPTGENILWLNGVAGSGKSTIAASILDYCDDSSRLAAYLFFERGKSDARSIIRTIAYHLAAFEPNLARHMPTAEELRNVHGLSPEKQFEKLLLGPLSHSVGTIKGPIIIILDALDECGSTEQRREILELLKARFRKLPLEFRFFVTSRPENDIMLALSRRSHILEIKLEHASMESRNDVRAYINNAMSKVVADPIPDVSAWANKIDILSRAADGLFIWASIAVKVVSNSDDPVGKLDELVSNIRSLNGLDNLYATVLEQSGISWDDARSVERFGKVVGLVLLGKEPVSDEDIDNILGLGQGQSRLTLQRLHSVLSYERGQPIRLHHASFADYLLSHEGSRNERWFVNANHQNHTVAVRCFEVMEHSLHFNMCNLETSFIRNDDVPDLEDRIAKYISSHVSYACRFWSEHLRDIPYSRDVADKLTIFTYNYMLYSLEVLSLTKQFNRVAGPALFDAVMWTSVDNDELSSFLWDAYRLVGIYAFPASQSTPHIYLSLLSFSKDESEVSEHFSQSHPIIETYRSGAKSMTACIKCFVGHTGFVMSVGFSPDGKRIVSGSRDRTVRVWDASSGEIVAGPFEGHTDWVTSVIFSPDGKRIVSGSDDRTVRVWDASSGEMIVGPLEGHTDWVTSVGFSPDGKRIVSGSKDWTVCVWDALSGEIVAGPFKGHTDWVRSVGFSPDGNRIISGSSDRTVRVWDASSGEIVAGPFGGHTDWVTSVGFSPDGKRIVSGSSDRTVCVWDASSGEIVAGPFGGHTHWVTSVGFSPDGKRIVSGSDDWTVRVWDAWSGEMIVGPFEGHTDWVRSVGFSPDGKRIVSGSSDRTVCVWDASSREIVAGPFEGHTGWVTSVDFSPDGKRIVSGSSDRTVRIWDASSGEIVAGPFEGHTGLVRSVDFSPDGKQIVSGSSDRTVCVWDASSGEIVAGPFEGHTDWVTSVGFSPDRKRIVSGSSDWTVCVWDASSGEIVAGPFEGHTGWVTSVDFSPDGKQIVSGSSDRTVSVWDASSGEIVAGPFGGHTGLVRSVGFSPDGKRIVSGSYDRTIRVWDALSGEIVAGPFEGHTDWVTSVGFSPDGKRIVSGSKDWTVRVWDASSGAIVVGPFEGHTDWVTSVIFSPDGKRVVSGSKDQTICMRDVETVSPASLFCAAGEEGEEANLPGIVNAEAPSTTPNVHTISNWTMSEDGWILSEQDELLIWVPSDLRFSLFRPYTMAILNYPFTTRLDFATAPIGTEWAEGFSVKQ